MQFFIFLAARHFWITNGRSHESFRLLLRNLAQRESNRNQLWQRRLWHCARRNVFSVRCKATNPKCFNKFFIFRNKCNVVCLRCFEAGSDTIVIRSQEQEDTVIEKNHFKICFWNHDRYSEPNERNSSQKPADFWMRRPCREVSLNLRQEHGQQTHGENAAREKVQR